MMDYEFLLRKIGVQSAMPIGTLQAKIEAEGGKFMLTKEMLVTALALKAKVLALETQLAKLKAKLEAEEE